MILKKATFLYSSLLVFFSGFLFLNLLMIQPSDTEEYQSYIDRGIQIKNQIKAHSTPVQQLGKNVQKDFWFYENDQRLHMRIFCQSAILTLILDNHKLKLFESLDHLHCCMQEKQYYDGENQPRQKLRYFHSPSGSYVYPENHFTAEKVQLSFSDEISHQLPTVLSAKTPFIHGHANQVLFSLSKKRYIFEAEHLKMHLNPKKLK